MSREGVLVVGSANMDLVVKAVRFPKPGETILGSGFGMFPGGKGANQAVAAAKLGGKVYFIGKMGNDLFNEKLVEKMTLDHVVMDHLFIDEKESTGIGLITVDDSGENEIVVVSGSNMRLTPDELQSKQELFSKVSVVLTQLEIPLETVQKTADLAKQSKAVFVLNPAPAKTLPVTLLKKIDFLTPNETELALLSGKPVEDIASAETAARELIKIGVKNLIVTLGEKGALFINHSGKQLFPAKKVSNIVDTTAAGDAFSGAFALGISNGRTTEEAIQFANKVAAYSVTKMGAQTSMPSLNEIEDF